MASFTPAELRERAEFINCGLDDGCVYCQTAAMLEAGAAALEREQQILAAFDTDEPCEQCGPMMMCSFHSLLSALAGRTSVQP